MRAMAVKAKVKPDIAANYRGEHGRFLPGCPGGGRAKLPEELRLMCQEKADIAIRTAAMLLIDKAQPGNVRLKAAEVILDRGYGKAPQSITIDVATATKDITDFLLTWLTRHSVNGVIEVQESQARQEIANGLLSIVGQAPLMSVVSVAEGEDAT